MDGWHMGRLPCLDKLGDAGLADAAFDYGTDTVTDALRGAERIAD